MPMKFDSTTKSPKRTMKKAAYQKGGKVDCYSGGGKVRGGGAAKRGLKFTRSC